MYVKKHSQKTFLIACGFALCLAGYLYIRHTSYLPVLSMVSTSSTKQLAYPSRLIIEKIHVDASIESVGVTSSGAMEAPTGPSGVAWFNLGPPPGAQGSAVIAGHYGWKAGKAAAFDRLNELRVGDTLTVEDSTGSVLTFKVRELHVYDAGMDATNIFTSHNGSHLNLITCIGTWDVSEKSYTQRLVVFTDLISSATH